MPTTYKCPSCGAAMEFDSDEVSAVSEDYGCQ